MKKLLISETHRKLIEVMAVLSSVRLASSLLIAVIFMGDYYNIENPHIRELWTMAEGFFNSTFGVSAWSMETPDFKWRNYSRAA